MLALLLGTDTRTNVIPTSCEHLKAIDIVDIFDLYWTFALEGDNDCPAAPQTIYIQQYCGNHIIRANVKVQIQ